MVDIRKEASGRIRIITDPKGEAPMWVRYAWIGLTLPCKPLVGFANKPSKHVLSGKPMQVRAEFDVPQREAIELLAEHYADAAKWWQEHGFPEGEDAYFAFGRDEAEIISGVTSQKLVIYDNMETGKWRPTGLTMTV
jgi:hypothetical protein